MRILAPEHSVYLDDLFLPFQCVQIMDGSDKVLFRRKFIVRMSPIPIGEYTKLPAGNELL